MPKSKAQDVAMPESKAQDMAMTEFKAQDVAMPESKAQDVAMTESKAQDVATPKSKAQDVATPKSKSTSVIKFKFLDHVLLRLESPTEEEKLRFKKRQYIVRKKAKGKKEEEKEAVAMPESESADVAMPEFIAHDVAMPESESEDVATPESKAQDVAMPESKAQDVAMPESKTMEAIEMKFFNHVRSWLESATEEEKLRHKTLQDNVRKRAEGKKVEEKEAVAMPESESEDVAMPEFKAQDVAMPESESEDVATPESKAQDVAMPGSKAQDVAMPESNAQDVATPKSKTMKAIEMKFFNHVRLWLESATEEEKLRHKTLQDNVRKRAEGKKVEEKEAVAMPESKVKEDRDAFTQWKLKWDKRYSSPGEEELRFKNFQLSLRDREAGSWKQTSPIWIALDELSDLSVIERFKLYSANNAAASSTDSDDEEDEVVSVKGQISDHEKDTKEEDVTDTGPPFKLQKIGCDDQKRGCCSDCRTGT